MDQKEFVNAIKEVVRDDSILGVTQKLEKPPGRTPEAKLVMASTWYNNLDYDQKAVVKAIIEMAVNETVFGFLCVIDGVRSVNKTVAEQGTFKLSFVNGDKESILNGTESDDYLHDMFNS